MIKFKDLYIILAPHLATHAHGCSEQANGTIQIFAQPGNSSPCCDGTVSVPPGPLLAWIDQLAVDPFNLGEMTLKDYLTFALNQQVTLSEMQGPGAIPDLASAAALEEKLSGALKEVKARKAELESV